MTPEELRSAIRLMEQTALEPDRFLQSRPKGNKEWGRAFPARNCGWNWYQYEYRWKPAQRELWVNYYEDGSKGVHGIRSDADKHACHNRVECVQFREVIRVDTT